MDKVILWISVGLVMMGFGYQVNVYQPCKTPVEGCRIVLMKSTIDKTDK